MRHVMIWAAGTTNQLANSKSVTKIINGSIQGYFWYFFETSYPSFATLDALTRVTKQYSSAFSEF